MLQRRIPRVKAALVGNAKRPIDVSKAFFVGLAGSLEVLKGLHIALLIEFEDSSVQVKVFDVEYVLVIVAVRLSFP